MIVDTSHGRCRSCRGTLEIVDADDVSLFVECMECGDGYQVETDAFGDGCMIYWLEMMRQKMEEGDDS